MIFHKPLRNLLRALFLSNELLNQGPGGIVNSLLRLPTSHHRHAMSLIWTVASLASIAEEFPTDRRWMHINGLSYLFLLMARD
jgi:hypothetical protein